MKMKGGTDPGVSNPCVVCNKATVEYSCKRCKGYIYCSKGCCKSDTKKHKRACSSLASCFSTSSRLSSEQSSHETTVLVQKHALYMIQEREKELAESRARARSVLSKPKQPTKGNWNDEALATLANVSAATLADISAASADVAAAREATEKAIANAAAARTDAARAIGDATRLSPESYSDAGYWEERHAKSRESDETYEWYTGYPDEALRKAFPKSVRGKKILVVGCGNSELSEKMCKDGFRDILSIDTSKSAIEQMSKRARGLITPQTTCRYQVMDAGRLDNLDSETFGGVVDKGTIDAVLSGGIEPARRICREAMRVLEPGGRFLVISNTPGEKLLETLLEMCGPGSSTVGDSCPLAVPVSGRGSADSPCVYAYVIRKTGAGGGGGVEGSPGGSNGDMQRFERSDVNGASDGTVGVVDEEDGMAGGSGDPAAPVLGGAPSSESELDSFPEERRLKSGVDVGREGEAEAAEAAEATGEGGPSSAEKMRALRKWCEQLRQKVDAAVSLAEQARSQRGEELKDTPPTITTQEGPNAPEGEDDSRGETGSPAPRSPPQAGSSSSSSSNGGGMESPTEAGNGREMQPPAPTRGRPPPQGKPPLRNEIVSPSVLSAIASLKARQAARSRKVAAEAAAAAIESSSGSVAAGQPPVSLPWGSQEIFTDRDSDAVYELRLEEELSASKLLVEVGPSRLKVSYLRGNGEHEVMLDRELYGKVTAESTWSVEDGKLLSFNLCKRVEQKWPSSFKRDFLEQQPAGLSPAGVSEREAGASSVTGDPLRREKPPTVTGCEPLNRAPAPPAIPRKHERSPKVDLSTGKNFKAPERFLLEDHTGIKKFQLYLSKPRGFKVSNFQVSRAGPEVCEVRYVCHDESAARHRPDLRFLQKAFLGRSGFDPDQASCSGKASDDLCIVGVPYGGADDSADYSSSEGVWRDGGALRRDLDDEGVHLVARLRCRFCGNLITPEGKALAVRAMPTGRWDECIEDMICFDGPQAVPMLSADVNFARPGRCLMAQVEVLLHPEDIVTGAVAFNEDFSTEEEASRGGCGDPGSIPGESADDDLRQWRSLECARCDLPLGRPAAPRIGNGGDSGFGGDGVSKEKRGLLLLKHCLVGDDLVADNDDCDANGDDENARGAKTAAGKKLEAPSGGGGTTGASPAEKGPESMEPQGGVGPSASPAPLPNVFKHRTAIKWLMGEMSFFNERDGCARFIVSARGRSPEAPGGSLSLVLAKMNSLVSIDGSREPGRAHRVAFREESRDEAERADEEETWAERESEPSLRESPPVVERMPDGSEGKESVGKTAAKVPARVLELSYGEYAVVRERLRRAAWAGAPSCELDSRGYSYSYLF